MKVTTTKIKAKHLFEQIQAAVDEIEKANPAGATQLQLALDAWSGHYDDQLEETFHLGHMIAEFVDCTIEYMLEVSEEEKEELNSWICSLDEKYSTKTKIE